MRDEPVYRLLDSIKADAAAWRHRADSVETHPGVQSAFLTCATAIERTLERYHRETVLPDKPDDAA